MTLEHMDQGLVVLDPDHVVRLCNHRALELLDLSTVILHENASLRDIRAFQNARGDFSLMPMTLLLTVGSVDAHRFPLVYDWPRPDGVTLEVRRVQLTDGSSINTFTDVTARRASEAAVRESESRYRLLNDRIEELAQTDELTGVLNRRYILRTLSEETARLRRSTEDCSVAIIDLDFFKQINDRYGHPAGDEVLRGFSIAICANIRDIDRLGRYGGEEFLLVLPRASEALAVTAINRLRRIVADLDWAAISKRLKVTMSAGVTQIRCGEVQEDILARVDAALYRAKRAGRNCVRSG